MSRLDKSKHKYNLGTINKTKNKKENRILTSDMLQTEVMGKISMVYIQKSLGLMPLYNKAHVWKRGEWPKP